MLCGEILGKEDSVILFPPGIGDFFKNMAQVVVGLKTACFGRFNQTVKSCGGMGTVGMT
jgi:hypothetical protein